MKNNPNNFRVGELVVLDETLNNRCEVVIHEITDTQRLAIIGKPGSPKEEWWIVQIKRLSPTKQHYGNN